MLVKAWNQLGYKNIYYVDARFTKTGDEKLIAIYMGYGLREDYDYIWNSKDRTMFSSEFLDRVIDDMSKNPDVILTARENDSYFFTSEKFEDEYTDPVTFFKDFGATTTAWDAIIFNRNTMFKGIDWDFYEREYKIGYSNPFNQPTVLFARLAELEKVHVIVERPKIHERLRSRLTGSEWVASTVDLWGIRWPEAINRLPSLYDDIKKHVIKVETTHINIFGTHGQLMGLVHNGYLNKDNFAKIREYFSELSDVPVAYVDMMIEGKINEVARIIWEDYIQFYREKSIQKIIWYHKSNRWMNSTLGEEVYECMNKYFDEYMYETSPERKKGYFDGIDSLESAIEKITLYYSK